jgi:phosphonate transport system permease protein
VGPARVGIRIVLLRRLVAVALVVLPVAWSVGRAMAGGRDVVNRDGLRLLDDLLATAVHPALDAGFLARVLDAAIVTLEFATLGTAGALLIGATGGLVLSDVIWSRSPSAPVRAVRLALRAVLVAARATHELVWALLLVSALGLDPLVAVLAIAIPFGAQTAKVFSETLDGVPDGPLQSLRNAGARPAAAIAYTVLPGATPLLLSYSFYRFECAIRSAVLLGVVGVGGLGQELVVSLQSRNWNEVWTLVAAVLVLSAGVDQWSTRVRADLAVGGTRRSRWARWSAFVAASGWLAACWASGVSPAGLAAPRTRDLTVRLLDDLWPPALPAGGWPELANAVLDTVAMAVLAMTAAVLLTLLISPWATRPGPGLRGGWGRGSALTGRGGRVVRGTVRWCARATLLVLRSVPPTVWALAALLVLFPGILPGALALALYTAGILGRLVAEAWESLDTRARDALRSAGVRRPVAAMAAMAPASAQRLLTYTLYRFEICVRDTAVVGVVGAAGLGRLLAENLAVFRFPVVTTALAASFVVSAATEVAGRRLRRAVRA